MTQRVLVTGGTGFTGAHLVKRLLSRGHQVVVLDKSRGLKFDELVREGAEVHLGSVTDRELVDGLTEDVAVVFHLAAAFREINVPDSIYWDVNVEGTRNVMQAAKQNGVEKVVYCSTQGVHGHVEVTPGDENAPIAPADTYQLTKYEGEMITLEFGDRGLDVVILRPTAIYGPGDPGRWLMLYRMVTTGRFLMFGDGKTNYHPVYIDNLIDAFELASLKNGTSGGTYIIGDELYYPLNELVTLVAGAIDINVRVIHLPFWPLWLGAAATEAAFKPIGVQPPIFRRRVDWFRQNRAFDIGKARRELGYAPKVPLAEGLRITGEWYKEQGFLKSV